VPYLLERINPLVGKLATHKPGTRMAMLKNATPRQLSIYVAFIIGGVLLACLIFFNLLALINIPWLYIFMFALITFAVTYVVLIFALRKYIYRKIKLIYKTIHKLKRQSIAINENTIEMDTDVLSKVEQDVSEWAASQEKEMESLRSLEEYRRNFLGNISHELKTPIFNMQGYLYTLLDGGLYDEKISMKYLRRASVNVQRLQTIVEDLEVISQLESGQLSLDLMPFSIRALAEECIDDHVMMAETLNISLSLKPGAESDFTVFADKENIRQVLNNLLANSIKYGSVAGQTKIGFYDMGDNILVEVADNGIGIDKEDLKHVFDRFYRVDKSRSRDIGGSGLGLSIVKHIIEAHKQTINLRSTLTVGSTFGFTLKKASSK